MRRTRSTLAADRRRTLTRLRDALPIEDRTLLILRVDRTLSFDDIALAFADNPEAFSDDDPEEKSTDVLVDDVTIGEEGDLILVRVGGSHFIWKMVRRMVGVLVEIGRGRIDPGELWTVDAAKLTAPSAGLFLERVFYAGDRRQFPLQPAMPVRRARE